MARRASRPNRRPPSNPKQAPKPRTPALPPSVRVARWAELAFAPLSAMVAVALPMAGAPWMATLIAIVQTVGAVAVFRFLPHRPRPAWRLGVLLAVFVLSGLLTNGITLIRATVADPDPTRMWSLVIAAWQWLTQIVALAALTASARWAHDRD